MKKPILVLDFDGVIHDYMGGWQDGSIYGEPTVGFEEWLAAAKQRFTVQVLSSRDPAQIQEWLAAKAIELQVVTRKPPAFLSIDDRSVRFDGTWQVLSLDPDKLLTFKPWMLR